MAEITELMFGVFRIDAEINRLQNEKLQMLQELVDSEIKAYGEISKETQSILDVQHSELINGKVREIKEWENQEEADTMKEKRVVSKEELDSILASQDINERKTVNLSNCIISNYVFKGDLNYIDFNNSELRYCEFRHTKADQISMLNTTLSDVKFVQAEFNQSDFSGADFIGVESRSSIFRNCSLNIAHLQRSLIEGSLFYKTSFTDMRIRQTHFSEGNVFYECKDTNTVRIETPAMGKEEAEKYKETVINALNNEGYEYSWELNGVNIEEREAELSVKVSYDGKIVENQKYTALLDDDTYEIVHVDTGRLEDPIVKMLLPEMNESVKESLGVAIEKTNQRVELKLPYMTRDTFMAVKEEIKRMGARFDTDNRTWYVESDAGQEVIDNINEYLSVHDEAIYLKLPPASPQKFKMITNQIKQNGAHYNPNKKAWYITEKEDRSQFSEYLPSDKSSVHEKLNQYKESIKEQNTDNKDLSIPKKESAERV